MSGAKLEAIVAVLRAAGETTRARILAALSEGELSVGELAQILGLSQPRLSRHMKFLSAAGLVERLPEGGWVFYRLTSDGPGHRVSAAILSELDFEDPVVKRDFDRLRDARASRAAEAEDYFARVAPHWDALRARHYSEAEIEQAVLRAAGSGPFDLVVDFGTGTGRMLKLFAGRARRLEGIDLSHHMLTVARANLEAAGVRNAAVRHGDATSTPFEDASVDLVIIHQVLHFLNDPSRAILEAGRVLRPGGRLVVVDFAPHQFEELREQHAHRHLGIPEHDLRAWASQADLDVGSAVGFPPPPAVKDALTVTVWTAHRSAETEQRRAAQ
ncbi:metalloregulator ArsR/SmtB family transcription factor [bacterium]|nr:metalloregulator ArsR/SmtB family transcription factor [bacterium]